MKKNRNNTNKSSVSGLPPLSLSPAKQKITLGAGGAGITTLNIDYSLHNLLARKKQNIQSKRRFDSVTAS
jgi:hypothetical protein